MNSKLTLGDLKQKVIQLKQSDEIKNLLCFFFRMYSNDYDDYLSAQRQSASKSELLVRESQKNVSETELSVVLYGLLEKGQTVQEAKKHWFEYSLSPSVLPYKMVLQEYANLSPSERSSFLKSIVQPLSHCSKLKGKKVLKTLQNQQGQ